MRANRNIISYTNVANSLNIAFFSNMYIFTTASKRRFNYTFSENLIKNLTHKFF